MPVPSPRLLGLAGLVLLPALTLAGLMPDAAGGWLALGLVAIAVAVIDALLGWPRIAAIGAQCPPVSRLTTGRHGRLRIRLLHEGRRPATLRMALSLPDAVHSHPPEQTLALPDAPASLVDWTLTPTMRGRFGVTHLHVEAPSPLGLWHLRRSLPLAAELRAQPNLGDALHANAAFLAHALAGQRLVRQAGKGREFEKLRDYVAGDPVDDIHWRATAKRGHPVSKVFQVERTQEVYVILDASRLSRRVLGPCASHGPRAPQAPEAASPDASPKGEPLIEHFIQSALLLGAVAERHGDLFGLATFDARVGSFVRADRGPSHFNACRERLVTLEARPVTPDFDEVASFLRVRLRRRALLLFLANLDDPVAADGFTRAVEVLRRQHLCVVVQPKAPGVEPVFSNDRVATQDDVVHALAGHMQWEGLRELHAILHARGVTMASAPPESIAAALVERYLNVKRRQSL